MSAHLEPPNRCLWVALWGAVECGGAPHIHRLYLWGDVGREGGPHLQGGVGSLGSYTATNHAHVPVAEGCQWGQFKGLVFGGGYFVWLGYFRRGSI